MTNVNKFDLNNLLIPVKKISRRKGEFHWPAQPVFVYTHSVDFLPLQQLRNDLSRHRIKARIAREDVGAAVRIFRDKTIANPEAYRLIITDKGIEVSAGPPRVRRDLKGAHRVPRSSKRPKGTGWGG